MERPSKKRRQEAPTHEHEVATHRTAHYDAAMMQQQLERFVRDGDEDSAQILGELLVSLALAADSKDTVSRDVKADAEQSFLARRSNEQADLVRSELPAAFHAKTMRLFADLMMAKREFQRAIRYYCFSCKDAGVLEKEEDLDVKLKIARCYVRLDCVHEAIEVVTD